MQTRLIHGSLLLACLFLGAAAYIPARRSGATATGLRSDTTPASSLHGRALLHRKGKGSWHDWSNWGNWGTCNCECNCGGPEEPPSPSPSPPINYPPDENSTPLTPVGFYPDMGPSTQPYGVCSLIDPDMLTSQWCAKGPLPTAPANPTTKFGRQTVYGTSSGGRGWCGQPLVDSDIAAVAVSTKYLPFHGVSPNSPYCGLCMCIRFSGNDPTSNPYPPPEASQYYGRIMKGRVMDMCPECEDDHIDILGAKPYTDIVPINMAYAVGIWTAEWQFADCSTDCTTYFSSPQPTPQPSPPPAPSPVPSPQPSPIPSPLPSPQPSPTPSPPPSPKPSPRPSPKPSPRPSPRPSPKPKPSPRPSPKPSPVPSPMPSPAPPSPLPSPPAPTPAPPGSLDTSGSTAPYGTCSKIDAAQLTSRWCSAGALSGAPSASNLKYGRQTVYGSSSPSWYGWCGQPLVDSDIAAVAISTKYLPLHGNPPNSPYCGQCMCIRIKGVDTATSSYIPPDASLHFGNIVKGRVMDICNDCEDDHINMLAAKPYTDVVSTQLAYTVSAWTAEWNFVDCSTDCSTWFSGFSG